MIGTSIDNLLFVNKQAFTRLYQECCQLKNFNVDRIDFFAQLFEVRLSHSKIFQQFCLSKTTILDEISKRFEYFQLNFVEWLEFVIRVFKVMLEEDKRESHNPRASQQTLNSQTTHEDERLSDMDDDEREEILEKRRLDSEAQDCQALQEYVYNRLEIVFEKRTLRLRDPAFWQNDSDSEAEDGYKSET